MTNATVKRPHNRLGRWLAKRVEHRIDRLWLISAWLVIIAIGWFVGIQLIPAYLLLYWYLFGVVFQKAIAVTYPHKEPDENNVFKKRGHLLAFSAYILSVLITALVYAYDVPVEIVSAGISLVVFIGILLMNKREGFSIFAPHSGTRKTYPLVRFAAKLDHVGYRILGHGLIFAMWWWVVSVFNSGRFNLNAPYDSANSAFWEVNGAIWYPLGLNCLLLVSIIFISFISIRRV